MWFGVWPSPTMCRYGTIFVAALGVINPFSYTACFHMVNICANLIALLFVDRWGRRPILVTMSLFQGDLRSERVLATSDVGHSLVPLHHGRDGTSSSSIGGSRQSHRRLGHHVWFLLELGFRILDISGHGRDSQPKAARLNDPHRRPMSGYRNVSYSKCRRRLTSISFTSSFTVPYLLDAPYADLGSKVGFIYGSFSVLAAAYVFFFIPELKNRSFEEVDILFHEKVGAIGSTKWRPTSSIMQELDVIAHGTEPKAADDKVVEAQEVKQA